jgi:hypothetical protein
MFINKPYPLGPTRTLPVLRQALLIGFFVAAFLFIFKPFGLHSIPPSLQWLIPIYGAITTLVILLFNLVFKPAFPKIFNEEKWTAGKEILENLSLIFCIALGNFLYTWFIGGADINIAEFLFMLLATMAVGIFPVTAIVGINYVSLLKRNLREAASMDELVEGRKRHEDPNQEEQRIAIPGVYGQEPLVISQNQLLWITTADNYIEVVEISGGSIQKHLIRNSLSAVEPLLEKYGVYRCHRSYLVHLDKVSHIQGNAQGYRLQFQGIKEEVPVSRSFGPGIRELLQSGDIQP